MHLQVSDVYKEVRCEQFKERKSWFGFFKCDIYAKCIRNLERSKSLFKTKCGIKQDFVQEFRNIGLYYGG